MPELLTFQTDAIPLDGSDCLLDSRLVRYQTTVCVWVCVCECMRVRVCVRGGVVCVCVCAHVCECMRVRACVCGGGVELVWMAASTELVKQT